MDATFAEGDWPQLPMATHTVEFDPQTNQALLAGSHMVFHCHYYNCAIHKSIEDALSTDAAELFRSSAFAAAQPQLAAIVAQVDSPSTRISKGATLFQQLGFGRFDPHLLTSAGGTVTSTSSHYALGWLARYGLRETPVCQFIEGYLQALMVVAYNLNVQQVRVKEVDCLATGDAACTFVVTVNDSPLNQLSVEEVAHGN
ncbi:MAG: 4-vinyl reductase [Cyanobacteria bacterium P01_D01_bin.156]